MSECQPTEAKRLVSLSWWFAAFFGERMDMQPGGLGASRENGQFIHELAHLLRCDILVAEEDDATLGD